MGVSNHRLVGLFAGSLALMALTAVIGGSAWATSHEDPTPTPVPTEAEFHIDFVDFSTCEIRETEVTVAPGGTIRFINNHQARVQITVDKGVFDAASESTFRVRSYRIEPKQVLAGAADGKYECTVACTDGTPRIIIINQASAQTVSD